MSKQDYLTEDNINPSDQKFVCVSFFSKTNIKQLVDNNNEYRKEDEKEEYNADKNIFSLKVRGSFSTLEEASKHAKKLQSVDEYHNVYVAEVGKWCPFILDEDEKYVKSAEYANDELNIMMKKYMENQEQAKVYHEYRKNDMIKKNIVDNLQSNKNNHEKINNKIENAESKEDKIKLNNSLESIEERINKLEEKKKEIEDTEKALVNKLKLNTL